MPENENTNYISFSEFIGKLGSYLYKYNFITKNTISELDDFLKSNIYSLRADRKRFGSNVSESILNKWYSRILNKLEGCPSSYNAEITDVFISYYKKCNYTQLNPLYRPFRILISRIGDILVNLGFINDNTNDNIVDLLNIDFRGTISNLKNNNSYKITIIPLKNLYKNLTSLFKTEQDNGKFNQIYKNYLDFIKDLFIKFIEKYDLQNDTLLDKLENNAPSQRLELIKQIIVNCDGFNNLDTISELSKLLFGDSDYITSHFIDIHRIGMKPELYILFRMIGHSLTWNLDNFTELGLDVNEDNLLLYQSEIEMIIKDFVFTSKYKNNYIANSMMRGDETFDKNNLSLEYEMILSLWQLVAFYQEDLSITFQQIKDFYDFGSDLTEYLVRGIVNIGGNLRKFYEKTIYIINTTSLSDKRLNIYNNTLDNILEYSKVRGVRLTESAKYQAYSVFFKKPIMSFHVISLLLQNLGFDILHFKPLDDNIFLNGNFIRHHFRYSDFIIDINSQQLKSSLLYDIILTSRYFHGSYRIFEGSIKGEMNIEKILTGFKILLQSNENINEWIIKKTFAELDALWVYYKWKNQGLLNFSRNIEILNKRVMFFKRYNHEQFINKFFENAFARFFDTYKDVKRNPDLLKI